MKTIVKLVLFTFLLIPLGSCNLFFSSPHGRENPDDDAAQIRAFTAVPSSDKSVVTMWNWTEPPSWANDDKITEIKIEHSIAGYPENSSILFGENFTDKNIWQHEWKDLIPGITHYFSLFAKGTNNNGDDTWYAPIKAKAKLPGTVETGVFYDRINSVNVDGTGIEDSLPDGTLEVGALKWAVLFFDIPSNALISHATITISLTGGSITDIVFVPLDNYLTGDGKDKWNALSDNSVLKESVEAVFSSNLGTFDITTVVQASVIGPEHAILIKTISSSFNIDNSASAPIITADIIK